MGLLTPSIEETANEFIEIVAANEVLQQTATALAMPKADLISILDSEGLSLRETIKQVSVLAKYSENEGVRLNACRTALELHGQLGAKKAETDRSIVINIGGNHQQNNVISPIFNPQR